MSEIRAKFIDNKPLITYISGGDPNLDLTARLIFKLQEEGADIIEIGIPFSDPLADGPVIQAASQRALQGGVTLKKLISKLGEIKAEVEVPLILMGYYNSILNYGEERFAVDIKKAGVAGVIIPDFPGDEKGEILTWLKKVDVDRILLVTPNTSEQRLEMIAGLSSGFLYAVAHLGITGEANKESPQLKSYLDRIREYSGDLPICLGFGIDTPEKAKRAGEYADGVIIGSALIQAIQMGEGAEDKLTKAGRFVNEIKRVLV
ncbi:MAG: tryptophan synthase subunit alpha [Bacillota bacterium]